MNRSEVVPTWKSLTAALLLCIVALTAAAESKHETPVDQKADLFLSADQMTGELWKVEPTATNDGIANTYTITSRYGSWQARGTGRVPVRIREVMALAQLEEISTSDVFMDAVKNSATAPLHLVQDVAAAPVETVKGIPGGVTRWVKKTSFQVQETYHDVKDTATKEDETTKSEDGPSLTEKGKDEASKQAMSYLKITGAEQRWYAQLGVDPWTDNEVLRNAISSVAKVEGLTNFGMKFVMPGIPGMGEVQGVMNAVWTKDPWELRMDNRKILLAAGISEETARAFEDNRYMTLTMQTAFLKILQDLDGVTGRQHLLARAIDCASREEAERLVTTSALLLRVHRKEGGLTEILPGSRLPVARKADKGLVAVLITDFVFWTENVAEAANEFAAAWAEEEAPSRELLITRESSYAFHEHVLNLGWKVRSNWLEESMDQ